MARKNNMPIISAVLMVATILLSYVKIFTWPFGTFVTLLSMVPTMIIVFKYGVKWGIFTGLMTGLIKGAVDIFVLGVYGTLTPTQTAVIFILDYAVAYAMLGFAGVFRDSIDSDTLGNMLGTGFAVILRFASHFVARFVLYGQQAKANLLDMKASFEGSKLAGTSIESMFASLADGVIAHHTGNYRGEIYAFIYTGSYMIPELIFTLLVVLILMLIPKTRDLISYD